MVEECRRLGGGGCRLGARLLGGNVIQLPMVPVGPCGRLCTLGDRGEVVTAEAEHNAAAVAVASLPSLIRSFVRTVGLRCAAIATAAPSVFRRGKVI